MGWGGAQGIRRLGESKGWWKLWACRRSMVPWPIFEHDFVFLDPAVILVRGCRDNTDSGGQGTFPHGLACLPSFYFSSFSSQPFSLGFPRAHDPESTNLLGTAHNPALHGPLAWAQMFPEGMGGQWLSGSQEDRSSPGGTGWGHQLWDLGGKGRVGLSLQ